ncbi:MAG: hydroxyphenylacetyl-CoA thioesterase PaaI [Gemmatimonadota bacterium]|nr:hydroxyphenylacetyl-CoA thioesterase PaaI [Gemmatimonadota bacterium]
MAETPQALAERCVQAMLAGDRFTDWMGMEVVEVAPQRSAVAMTVRPEMTNGFGVCHGGVTFSLADSALAFASNTHGRVTMSIENGIRYTRPARVSDRLTATAVAEHVGGRIGYYRVTVTNQDAEVVALFTGTVYATERRLVE